MKNRAARLLAATLAVLLTVSLAWAQSPAPHPAHGGHHDFGDVEASVRAFEAPDRAAWQKPDQVVAALGLKPGQTVADIGASTGYFARRLATAVGPTGTVWALDVEATLTAYVNERAKREGQTNLVARTVKLNDPELAPHSVDLVLIVDTLHHISQRPAYYAHIARALKKGGRLAIIDFLPTSPIGPKVSERLPKPQVESELRAAGFRVLDAPDFLPYQYFLIATPR